MKSASTRPLATAAFRKHLAVHGNLDHYTGIVSLHGLARLATETGDEALLSEARSQLMPYVNGERCFQANFPNYFCGGNGTAWMLYRGHLPEAADTVRHYADEIMQDARRSSEGILSRPRHSSAEAIWIDVAFAVTPFLLFAGLALEEEKYVEEAFQQTAKMVRAFRLEETGLLVQCRGFHGPERRTEDHWSRGNGWGALALAELAAHLPETHPRKEEAVALYRDHVRACANFQDKAGLWHQEMTELQESYVETSGSALMLYALGSGLAAGLIEASERGRFEKGIKGLLAYINEDHDIYHASCGCLWPGQGTKLDYMAKPPVLNDRHAFGPVVLAMGQAHLLGIESIARDEAL